MHQCETIYKCRYNSMSKICPPLVSLDTAKILKSRENTWLDISPEAFSNSHLQQYICWRLREGSS